MTDPAPSSSGGRIRPAPRPRVSGFTSLVDVVFPVRCIACRRPLDRSFCGFCGDCANVIDALAEEASCPTCAGDVGAFATADGRCRQCRDGPRWVTGTVRGGTYRSLIGDLLRRHKYGHGGEIEPVLARLLTDAVLSAPWRNGLDAIVAVPSHWRRRLTRGASTADTLAQLIERRAELPIVRALRRVRCGPHQIGLSYTKRAENVRGAFSMAPGITLDGPIILLIDDVRTTGATLNECARVLKKAGAKTVYAAVVARVGFDDKRDVKSLRV